MKQKAAALNAATWNVKRGDWTPTRPRRKLTEAERFEALVDRSGGPTACHPFLGSAKPKHGYGQFWAVNSETGKKSSRQAHRYAYELAAGKTVPRNIPVLHSRTCTTRRCCNPLHLREGTHLENMADARALGSFGKRLKVGDVLKIVALRRKHHLEIWVLAERFGVTNPTIHNILTGKTWSKATGIEYVRGKPGRPRKALPAPTIRQTEQPSLEAVIH